MNLLDDPLIDTRPLGHVSLPQLLAGMARGEVKTLPALRPHQRASWHCFMTQLAVMAMSRAGLSTPPEDAATWRDLLIGLTDGAGPWSLVAPPDQPAFMQPAKADGLNWKVDETPDLLDMLITSRNHDLKRRVARQSTPQDWIFALVSLQTSGGYDGGDNRRIMRMNRGASSRPMLAFIPVPDGSGIIDPSLWWRHDVAALLSRRGTEGLGTVGGPTLLWCLPWAEGVQLDATKLDPLCIEVCRRVRLIEGEGDRLLAERSTSKVERIAGEIFSGVTDDPWTPVTAAEPKKSLTLGEGKFTYKRMNDLLFSGKWKHPPIFDPSGGGIILAEALGRGNSKTFGLQSRQIFVPPDISDVLFTRPVSELAKKQIEEIALFEDAIKSGIATLIFSKKILEYKELKEKHKDKETNKENQKKKKKIDKIASMFCNAFDARADALFFPALWDRVRGMAHGVEAKEQAEERFLQALLRTAQEELERALQALPISSIRKPRALVRARRAFERTLWRSDRKSLIFTNEKGADT